MTSQLSPNNRRTTHRHSRRIAGSLGIVAALAAATRAIVVDWIAPEQ